MKFTDVYNWDFQTLFFLLFSHHAVSWPVHSVFKLPYKVVAREKPKKSQRKNIHGPSKYRWHSQGQSAALSDVTLCLPLPLLCMTLLPTFYIGPDRSFKVESRGGGEWIPAGETPAVVWGLTLHWSELNHTLISPRSQCGRSADSHHTSRLIIFKERHSSM